MKKYITYILTLLTFFIPISSYAAEMHLNVPKSLFTISEEFVLQADIDTQGASINAIEGTLLFPSDLVELKEIRDGDSIVTFWIEKPVPGKDRVTFSGIIPGGYLSPSGRILSFVFQTKKEGTGAIELRDVHAIQNDQSAATLSVKPGSFALSVSSETKLIAEAPIKDTTAPENFTVSIARNPDIYAGAAFIAFATQDKGVGIDHYEVKEGRFSHYNLATSPYLLQNQNVDSKIFVKAVDRNGNERVSVMYGDNYHPWYANYYTLFVIILLLIFLSFMLKNKSVENFLRKNV